MKIIISNNEILEIIQMKLAERFDIEGEIGGDLMINPRLEDPGCEIIFEADVAI